MVGREGRGRDAAESGTSGARALGRGWPGRRSGARLPWCLSGPAARRFIPTSWVPTLPVPGPGLRDGYPVPFAWGTNGSREKGWEIRWAMGKGQFPETACAGPGWNPARAPRPGLALTAQRCVTRRHRSCRVISLGAAACRLLTQQSPEYYNPRLFPFSVCDVSLNKMKRKGTETD